MSLASTKTFLSFMCCMKYSACPHLTEIITVLNPKQSEGSVLLRYTFFKSLTSPSGKLRRRQFYSQPLENGRVLSQGSTFTYQDVLDQLLVYTPETVSGGADEMGFTLTDGVYTHMGRLEFTMDVTKSEGPRMTVNRGLQLPAGEDDEEDVGSLFIRL